MLRQDDYVRAKIVEAAWRFGQSYSGGGHLVGQTIMHTLGNRVRVGWGSWLQVIDRIPAFMAEKELPVLTHPPIWEPLFMKLLQTVEGVYDGSTPDLSKGALYWGDLSRIEAPWFQEKIISAVLQDGPNAGQRVHSRVVDINNISFFR